MTRGVSQKLCFLHISWLFISCLDFPSLVECKKPKQEKKEKPKEIKPPPHIANFEFQTFKVDSSEVRSVAFSPDGLKAVTGHYDHAAKIWIVANSTLVRTFLGHTGVVLAATFSPDGLTIITCSSDNTAKYWDVATGNELLTLKGHSGWVVSAAFAPSAKLALTGSNDGTAKLWDLDFGEAMREFNDHSNPTSPIMSVGFTGDGEGIVMGTGSNSTLLFNIYNSEPKCDADQSPSAMVGGIVCRETVRPMSLMLHRAWVVALAACPGNTLVSGSHDGIAGIWNGTTGKLLSTLSGHGGSVSAVACSPDGKTVFTGSRAGDVHLWDSATGTELLRIDTSGKKRKDRRRFKGGLPDPGSSLTSGQFMSLGKTAVLGFLQPAPPKPIEEDPRRAQCLSECAAKGEPAEEVMFPL